MQWEPDALASSTMEIEEEGWGVIPSLPIPSRPERTGTSPGVGASKPTMLASASMAAAEAAKGEEPKSDSLSLPASDILLSMRMSIRG